MALGVGVVVFLVVAAPGASATPPGRVGLSTAAAVEKITGTVDVLRTDRGDRDSVAIVRTSVATVDIPRKLERSVKIAAKNDLTIGIGLPSVTDQTAVVSQSGTIVYANSTSPVDVAVHPTVDGVRALVAIKNSGAPTEYRFPLELPSEAQTYLLDTGEVIVATVEGDVMGKFDAPWAKDADGKIVPTRYRLDKNTLVQVIDFNADTVFPVVADPWWKPLAGCAQGAIGVGAAAGAGMPWWKRAATFVLRRTVAGALVGCALGAATNF